MYRSVFLADEAGKVRPYSSLELQSAQMNVDGELVFWERYGQSLTKHLVHGKYRMMGNPFPTTKDLGKQQANQAVINDVQRARVESAAEKGKIAAPIQATASTVYNTEYLIHLPAEADFLVVTPENFKEFINRFLTPCPQYHQIDKKAKKDLDSISDMKDIVEFLNASCE